MPSLPRSAAAVACGALIVTASPAFAAGPSNGYAGHAYGSTVHIGSSLRSGKTAYEVLCTNKTGVSHSDKTAAVTVPELGTIGAVTTNVSSKKLAAGAVESISTTHTGVTSLLAGAIHVSAIDTRAVVKRVGHHYTHSGSTTFVGLTVAGVPVPSAPSLGEPMSLPTLGSIVFNRQHAATHSGTHALTVTAFTLTIDGVNTLGLPGGKVVIGQAAASLHAPVHHLAYGSAYGTSINLGGVVKSGRTAPAYLPCGGSTKVETNTAASGSIPMALSGGLVTDRAVSTDSKTRTTATTRSRIAGISLGGGMVTASAITARAHAVRKGSKVTTSSAGTTVGDLTVNGMSEPANKATTESIPGLGTLYVDRVVKSKTGIRVYALELVLSAPQGGLAAGADIIIGAARAGVTK
jgi:hypothetical protein